VRVVLADSYSSPAGHSVRRTRFPWLSTIVPSRVVPDALARLN
jgi:hypothetical protein